MDLVKLDYETDAKGNLVTHHIVRWELADGSLFYDELSVKEYEDLALPGAGAPPRAPKDAVNWLAYNQAITTSGVKTQENGLGHLAPGEYVENNGALLIRLPLEGESYLSLESTDYTKTADVDEKVNLRDSILHDGKTISISDGVLEVI